MSLQDREQQIMLDILDSLARSQRALARIIESVAVSVERSPQLSGQVADNLAAIVSYQQILARKITGLPPVRLTYKGTPGHPWLNPHTGIRQGIQKPSSSS